MNRRPASAAAGRIGTGLLRRAGSAGKSLLAVAGVWAIGSAALDYKWEMEEKKRRHEDGDAEKKKQPKEQVLVLPFHRMQIVEKAKPNALRSLAPKLFSRLSNAGDGKNSPIEIEIHDLVRTIDQAAHDPSIVGLYGVFGHGGGFSCGGLAHIEEIRTAIRRFNEAHRIHPEPNIAHEAIMLPRSGKAKLSYAFADTFSGSDSINGEYFLASSFKQIYMQPQGDLHLFGFGMSVPFVKSFLDKYGITAHVIKNGRYKNAANSLTEKDFTREHKENTLSIIHSINGAVHESIAASRSLPASFDSAMWQSIFNFGILSAQNAQEVALVDAMPLIDPIDSLLDARKKDDTKREVKEKLGTLINVDEWRGTTAISLQEYKSTITKRESNEKGKWRNHAKLKHFAEKSSATKQILSTLFGYNAPNYNIPETEYALGNYRETNEKIVVIHVSGGIMSPMAKTINDTLRKIKKDDDIKCVVLRVDSRGGSAIASELIYQQLKDLSKPVVCSMSNYAASGGYYLSAHCDRIFALPTSITGSIGVFGVKFDLTKIAAGYGVSTKHIGSGPFSNSNSPFQPMSPKVEDTLRRKMGMTYDCFKSIVSSGRNLKMDEVEMLAQGRVWTGVEAFDARLIDELGGLDRAISYAKSKHTSNGEANVEYWPKPATFAETASKLFTQQPGGSGDVSLPDAWNIFDPAGLNILGISNRLDSLNLGINSPEPMLTIDANDAIQFALEKRE